MTRCVCDRALDQILAMLDSDTEDLERVAAAWRDEVSAEWCGSMSHYAAAKILEGIAQCAT